MIIHQVGLMVHHYFWFAGGVSISCVGLFHSVSCNNSCDMTVCLVCLCLCWRIHLYCINIAFALPSPLCVQHHSAGKNVNWNYQSLLLTLHPRHNNVYMYWIPSWLSTSPFGRLCCLQCKLCWYQHCLWYVPPRITQFNVLQASQSFTSLGELYIM